MINPKQHPKPMRGRHAFTVAEHHEIFALALHLVANEKRYLDPYLTLETLAAEINVHRNALSAAVNRHAGMNFPVWIANYRLTEVEQLACMPENKNAYIADLALRAGFANRTSFYRTYRNIRQGRPKERLRNYKL